MTATGPKECPNDDRWSGPTVPVRHRSRTHGDAMAHRRRRWPRTSRSSSSCAPRVQHRRPVLRADAAPLGPRSLRTVHEDPVGSLQVRPHLLDDRLEVEAGAPDPVAQGRPVEGNPLPPVDLGLTVERQVVSELGDDDLGDQRLGRQAAGHHVLGRMRLDHGAGAAAAGVSGAPRDQHAELRRDDVETLVRHCSRTHGDTMAHRPRRSSPSPRGGVAIVARTNGAPMATRGCSRARSPARSWAGASAGCRGSASAGAPSRPSRPSGPAAPSPAPPPARPGRSPRPRAAG